MASTTDSAINLEEESEVGREVVDGWIFRPDCNPFSDPISESGSGSFSNSEPDLYSVPVESFYPEVYVEYVLTTDDWGFFDLKKDDYDSAEQGLRVTGIDYEDVVFGFTSEDNGYLTKDSAQVKVDTGLPPVLDHALEEKIRSDEDWEELQNAINWTISSSEEEKEWEQMRNLVIEMFRSFSCSGEQEEGGEEEGGGEEEEEEEEGEEEGEEEEEGGEEEEELSSPSIISSRCDGQEEYEQDGQVWYFRNVANYNEQDERIMIDHQILDEDDYYPDEYYDDDDDVDDAILGEMFDDESGIRGNPPAAKRVVEDLPIVELTEEELSNGNIVCAVCKDEMVIEEKVKKLPCKHLFHGECIIPWLVIRNTCPVCRFELPTDDTDDLEYERL